MKGVSSTTSLIGVMVMFGFSFTHSRHVAGTLSPASLHSVKAQQHMSLKPMPLPSADRRFSVFSPVNNGKHVCGHLACWLTVAKVNRKFYLHGVSFVGQGSACAVLLLVVLSGWSREIMLAVSQFLRALHQRKLDRSWTVHRVKR
jgi:hypothetical protein